MSKQFVLTLMVFCHIMNDYCLQTLLISLKQRLQWTKGEFSGSYKNGYASTLLTRGFSWAFIIMFPVVVFYRFNMPLTFYILLITNCLIYAYIDDLEAGKHKISTTTNQSLHITQLVITFIALIGVK